MPRKALTSCSVPGCPQLVLSGRCADHRLAAEQRRGSSTKRGYGKKHRSRFRRQVLERDICCVLCRERGEWELATVADHWPLSRRELVERDMDPDDPAHGRGLCVTCHNRSTSKLQPGGWNSR